MSPLYRYLNENRKIRMIRPEVDIEYDIGHMLVSAGEGTTLSVKLPVMDGYNTVVIAEDGSRVRGFVDDYNSVVRVVQYYLGR